MIPALAALLGCQLGGEILVRALTLPIPGPVAGLGILFFVLVLRGRRSGDDPETAVPPELGRVCDALLRNLSLLFIPAAVGVIKYGDVVRAYAGPLALAIAVSTASALIVTAATFRFVSRLHVFRHEPLPEEIERAAGLPGPGGLA